MTPDKFEEAGKRLFGSKHWKFKLAQAFGVDPATIYRLCKRKEIPGPYEVALKGLLQHHRAQAVLEKEARKLLPRKFRYRRKTKKDGTPVVRLTKKYKPRAPKPVKVSENEMPFEDKLEQTVEMNQEIENKG